MFQSQHGELQRLASSDADIYLQGAHLTRFRDWLFLSDDSKFARGQSLRGGVPVIFPWFGPNKSDATLPQHGWARTKIWQVENAADDAVTLMMQHDAWQLRMKFGFGEQLRMRLEVENQSQSARDFECALHTYYAVDDIEKVVVSGLDRATYLDKTANYARTKQRGDVTITSETDRVYLNSPGPIEIRDGARTLRIVGESGWRSTVVWNPWQKTAANMNDLSEWRQFVCVECGAIADDAITLGAGENYALDISVATE